MKIRNTNLVVIINSEKEGDQNSLWYFQSIPGIQVTTVDLAEQPITEEELIKLAEKMQLDIEDLLDPEYDHHISVHTEGLRLMGRQSLLSLMTEDTKLISTPIVVLGDQAFMPGRDQENDNQFEMVSRFFTQE